MRCRYRPGVRAVTAKIDLPRDEVAAFCRRWQIVELALFGSVLREDFSPGSDIDVLAQFDPRAHHTLLDLAEMQDELSGALGRRVDLIERSAVEASRNYLRCRAILGSTETIYAKWRRAAARHASVGARGGGVRRRFGLSGIRRGPQDATRDSESCVDGRGSGVPDAVRHDRSAPRNTLAPDRWNAKSPRSRIFRCQFETFVGNGAAGYSPPYPATRSHRAAGEPMTQRDCVTRLPDA